MKVIFWYMLMVVAAVCIFAVICSIGERLTIPSSAPEMLAKPGPRESGSTLLHVLLALALIIVVARAMGVLFSFIQQPAVIGEVVGGIMLGPSILGKLAPGVYADLLSPSVAPFLSVIAQLGVILYMFLVGLELDPQVLGRNKRSTIAISHASIVVPFLLGSGLALGIYPRLSPGGVRFLVFALFIGVSMSVTAFPVLARILTDLKMSKTRMGTMSLTCAAVDDVTAWCLLAFVVSIAHERATDALRTIALTMAFIIFIFVAVKPLMQRLIPHFEKSSSLSRNGLAIIFVAMIASAIATEYIGIHAIFGAYLMGAVIPNRTRVALELSKRLEDVISVLFLPVFFAFTGMRTQIGLVSGVGNWFICGLIIVVACVGKFGGTFVASRLMGLRWGNAAALGVLMNTRGLVELIVLNIGLDLKIISPTLFAMLVIMALVTTFLTTPVLTLIVRKHPWVRV